MKWSISLFGKHINFGESVRVSLISSAGNFFAPAGSGLGFRAIYLKKRHGLLYSDYLSTLYCNYVMVFFVNSVLGLISLLGLMEHSSISLLVLAIFFLVLIIASLGAFFIRIRTSDWGSAHRIEWIRKLLGILERISKGWSLILADKKVALGLFSIVLFNAGLMITGAYFIMSALGLVLLPSSLLLFSTLWSLSIFINITPGNLGVKEAVYITFSAIIGLTATQMLSVALVDRAVMFVVLFLLWLIYGKNLYLSSDSKLKLNDQISTKL